MGIGWVIDNGFSAHIDNPIIKGMKHKTNPVFPEGFLWGASSAAWQCEGATLEGGRTQAIIDLNSQTKKPYTDNSVACDHYHHYKADSLQWTGMGMRYGRMEKLFEKGLRGKQRWQRKIIRLWLTVLWRP